VPPEQVTHAQAALIGTSDINAPIAGHAAHIYGGGKSCGETGRPTVPDNVKAAIQRQAQQ
jgi:hypothetical protein